jgi:hypothetical protein
MRATVVHVDRDATGWHTLDRMAGPDGVLRLVAFEESGTIQVGVASDRDELLASIGLRSPSMDTYGGAAAEGSGSSPVTASGPAAEVTRRSRNRRVGRCRGSCRPALSSSR